MSLKQSSIELLPISLRNQKENTQQLSAKRDLRMATFYGDATAAQELLSA